MRAIAITAFVCAALVVGASASGCSKPYGLEEFDDNTYYANARGKSGTALQLALNQILKQNALRYSYSCVWSIIQDADEDPNNSNNVILLYKRTSVPKSAMTNSDNGGVGTWNREHVWAKSHGFPVEGLPAYTDGHHLRASDPMANSERGNKGFDVGGSVAKHCDICHTDADSWEPPNESKGDVARMIFYMATRYAVAEGNMPKLVIDNKDGPDNVPRIGKLCTLIEWHNADPVSDLEHRRNDAVYSWQRNRNPYIDHPEWVNSVFNCNLGSSDAELPWVGGSKTTFPVIAVAVGAGVAAIIVTIGAIVFTRHRRNKALLEVKDPGLTEGLLNAQES